MPWNRPELAEIKMDAEISSYQDDGDTLPFVAEQAAEQEAPAEPLPALDAAR